MNDVSIIGRLTRDPEPRTLPNGTELCALRIAVDRAGPKQDDGTIGAGFFDVTLWGRSAEVAAQHLTKGRQVGISGELRWREWETDDGSKRQAVEINGRSFTFIGSREGSDGAVSDAPPPAAADLDDFPF